MNMKTAAAGEGFAASGNLNRVAGWTLIVGGLAASALLDPWFFSARTSLEFSDSLRPAVRHAQGVVLAMAFLQLAMAHLLATPTFPLVARRIAARLTASGAALYALGYVLGCRWPAFHLLVLPGSLMNLGGFSYLLYQHPTGSHASKLKVLLPVACFGMLLDLTSGILLVLPDSVALDLLGPSDGVRLRMLRLARVAAIALAVLNLLYQAVAHRTGTRPRLAQWGGRALVFGAVAMPTVLAAACFTSIHLKYLLPLPATAVLIGVVIALGFALRSGTLLERWGWLLIAVSISAGMIMGLYAFDGPLPAPEILGTYNAVARRLSRIAHSYGIVMGMLFLFLSRQLDHPRHAPAARIGTPMLVVGSITTLVVILLQIVARLPTAALAAGPAIVTVATVLSLAMSMRRA